MPLNINSYDKINKKFPLCSDLLQIPTVILCCSTTVWSCFGVRNIFRAMWLSNLSQSKYLRQKHFKFAQNSQCPLVPLTHRLLQAKWHFCQPQTNDSSEKQTFSHLEQNMRGTFPCWTYSNKVNSIFYNADKCILQYKHPDILMQNNTYINLCEKNLNSSKTFVI